MPSPRPPLVLIHGWGLGRVAWEPARPALAQAWNGPIATVDLPGYGDAPAPTDFLHAADALAECIPAGAVPCAWSLGALLLLRAASWQPHRWPGLVLVGATPRFMQGPDWPAAQAPAVLEAFQAAAQADPALARQRFVALVHQGDRHARALIRADQQALAAGAHPTVSDAALAQGLAWLHDVDLRSLVPHLQTPTLVLHGQEDRLTPPQAGQWLADHLGRARWRALPGAAHAPFRSDPEAFAAALVEGWDAWAGDAAA